MLQVFNDSLASENTKSLVSIDLYDEQPPWYDNAIYDYLWTSNNEKKQLEREEASESIEYMQRHTQIFNEADLVVIAAPVWNSSIPAILKAWIDLIISPNHTYRFGANGIEAIHHVKKILWLISSGGPEEKVNASNHFLATQQAPFQYIGIEEMDVIWADRQEPALFEDHQQRLSKASKEIKEYVKQQIINI